MTMVILLFGLDHNFVSLMFLLHAAIFSHSNPNFPYENTHTSLWVSGWYVWGLKLAPGQLIRYKYNCNCGHNTRYSCPRRARLVGWGVGISSSIRHGRKTGVFWFNVHIHSRNILVISFRYWWYTDLSSLRGNKWT